jgi:hypothetical protein
MTKPKPHNGYQDNESNALRLAEAMRIRLAALPYSVADEHEADTLSMARAHENGECPAHCEVCENSCPSCDSYVADFDSFDKCPRCDAEIVRVSTGTRTA